MRVLGAGWRIRRGQPRGLVVAVHLLLALAVVCGTLHAGARYFYCEALGLSTSDPCAAQAHSGNPCPLQSIERQSIDCCSVLTLPSMPEGANAARDNVPPAGLVAVLPVHDYVRSIAGSVADGFARGVQRWERPPRPGGDLRTRLMVFLT
jgi:hypothetical protein